MNDIYKKLRDMSKDKSYETREGGTPLGFDNKLRDEMNKNYNSSLEELMMNLVKGEKNENKRSSYKEVEDIEPEFVNEFLKKRKFKVIEDMK